MNKNWSNDWKCFVEQVGRLIDDGLDTEALTKYFGGKTACWSGKVDSIKLENPAPGVSVDFPKTEIELNDGTIIDSSELYLPLDDDFISHWSEVKLGDMINFETTLGGINTVFPPVKFKMLSGGRSILLVSVHDTKLIL